MFFKNLFKKKEKDGKNSNPVNEIEARIKIYQNALKYLDSCGNFSFEDYVKVYSIANIPITEKELRTTWDDAKKVLSSGSQPGGKEYLLLQTRNSIIEAINTFKSIVKSL